uniref:Tetratricopeptide repeat protein 29 n=1 Tax=Cuerna arida TaxID=1464854 RepID=A0A1B6EWT9_9HEMI
MKGSQRKTLFSDYSNSKTDFSDWSDPKDKPLRRKPLQFETTKDDTRKSQNLIQNVSVISETTTEIDELRKKLREGQPLLSLKEIRTFKLPFHESLLLNLKDDGFLSTYAFINDLIVLDEAWHEERSKNPVIKNRPFLKFKPFALNALSDGLSKAELAKKDENDNEELRHMLGLALYFSKLEDSWHWIAEELYEQCIDICNNKALVGKLEEKLVAITKYLYAKFLLEALHNFNYAKTNVEESMALSLGKFWNASEMVGESCDILYFESCLLLHKIYLQMANEERSFDIENAINFCRNACYWAKQINCKSAEANALLNLVIIYLAAKMLDPVMGHLENYMKLCDEQKDIKGRCEGYILLASYHKLKDQDGKAVAAIHNLLNLAEENKIEKMTALAHRKLATVFLMQGKVEEMQQHAIKAYNYYVKLNSKHEMEETRCLTGLAQAQEIMSQYLYILMEAENVDVVEFNILMWWKCLRIPFFTNTKLFQPEAEINLELKDRMEAMKREEMSITNKARQAEMVSTLSSVNMNRFTMRFERSSSVSSAFPRMSSVTGVIAFQKQLKDAATLNSREHSKRSTSLF